jgi:hypothetical protein
MERDITPAKFNAIQAIGQARGGQYLRKNLYVIPTLAGWVALRVFTDYGYDESVDYLSVIKGQTIQDILDWID